jgi:glutamate-5-semialdehyde dehydrogenase
MLHADEFIDVIIPRGGEGLIRFVAEHSRIPVIKHYKGVCHEYVDAAAANLEKRWKSPSTPRCPAPVGLQRPRERCWSHRSHRPGLPARAGPPPGGRAASSCAADEATRALIEAGPATEDDWHAEYLDLILRGSHRRPGSKRRSPTSSSYGSDHTEAMITTEDPPKPFEFLNDVRLVDRAGGQRLDPVRRRRRAGAWAPRSASAPPACTPTARWGPTT